MPVRPRCTTSTGSNGDPSEGKPEPPTGPKPPIACAHLPERSIDSMSPVRQFVFVCLAPLLVGTTESKPEERKSFASPEHQEKVRKPMHHLKRSLLVCLFTLVLATILTAG